MAMKNKCWIRYLLLVAQLFCAVTCLAQAKDENSPPLVQIRPGLIFKLDQTKSVTIDLPGQVATFSNYDTATVSRGGQTIFTCASRGPQTVHLIVKNKFATLEYDVPIKIISSAVFDGNYPDINLSCATTFPDFKATAHDVCSGMPLQVQQVPEAGTQLAANSITVITLSTANADGDIERKTFKANIGDNSVAPVVTISATRCGNGNINFSTPPVNGATAYQWLVNGQNAGIGGNRFNSNALANTDVVNCIVSGYYPCTPGSAVISNSIKVSDVKQNYLIPGVSIDPVTQAYFCPGTAFTLTATPVNGGTSPVYKWMINGIATSETSAVYSSSNFRDGDVITCTMTSDLPCLDQPVTSAPVVLRSFLAVPPILTITSSAIAPACKGSPVTFTAGYTGPPNPDYQWSVNGKAAGTNSSAFTTSTLNDGDQITCEAKTTGSCMISTKSNVITTRVIEPPKISFPGKIVILPGNSVVLNPVITGDIASYTWQPADGLTDLTSEDPTVAPVNTVTYHLHVVAKNGCEADGSVKVTVNRDVMPPNTFTPNGDGKNDRWDIVNIAGYPNCRITVFNRYGQRVYHSIGYPALWDGALNGRPLPAGTYYYIIDLRNNTPVLAGPVTIIR